MDKVTIPVQKFRKNLENVVNKRISLAWKGYGSALFLELGNLHNELAWEKGGKPTAAPTGEWTLASEGAWKLIRHDVVILDGEKAKDSEIEKMIKTLENLTIKSIELTKKLILHLSNGDILELNNADYGYFTLSLNEKINYGYENDVPYVQQISL